MITDATFTITHPENEVSKRDQCLISVFNDRWLFEMAMWFDIDNETWFFQKHIHFALEAVSPDNFDLYASFVETKVPRFAIENGEFEKVSRFHILTHFDTMRRVLIDLHTINNRETGPMKQDRSGPIHSPEKWAQIRRELDI